MYLHIQMNTQEHHQTTMREMLTLLHASRVPDTVPYKHFDVETFS